MSIRFVKNRSAIDSKVSALTRWKEYVMNEHCPLSRRQFIKTAAAGAVLAQSGLIPALPRSSYAATPRVAIARCRRYEFELIKTKLAAMFDSIGGLQTLVNGKTLTIKVNLTSYRASGIYSLDAVETVYTHPMVVLAACSLFQDYGAKRQIIVESMTTNDEDKTAFNNNWTYTGHSDMVSVFDSTIANLEWENTRNKGTGSKYVTFPVGEDAYVYKSFDFNHRYYDTDVMVSIAKLKNHDIAGVTLSMKNLFGITPNAVYADPGNERATATRNLLHTGDKRPSAEGEILPVVGKGSPGHRVPRIVVDINRARPIDLAIIDGIVSMTGGEGSWNGKQVGISIPNLLIAGTNSVAVDAVAASVMGFDPKASDYTKPFYNGANTIRLAAERGLGTNNLEEIEVAGLSIEEARYTYLPGEDKT